MRRLVRRSPFLTNLLSVSGASFLSQLIGLIALGYSARVLGPEYYGMVAFGTSVAGYASILLAPGLITWGIRAIAQDPSRTSSVLVIIKLTQLMFACVGFVVVASYAHFFLTGIMAWVVCLYALGLFVTAMAVDWVYYGLQQMVLVAALSIVNSSLNVLGLFTLIRAPEDVYRLPLLGIAIPLLVTTILYVFLFQRHGVRLRLPPLAEVRVALASAIPLSITAVLIVLIRYTNGLILNAYLGTLALGVFYAAFRLVELASLVPNLVSSVFLPHLSFQVANHGERVRAQARLYAQFQMVGGFFLSAVIFAEAPSIIQIIYGARYVSAVELLRVMSIAVLFTFAIVSYTNCLIAFRQDWAMVRILMVSFIVGVGSGFALVPLVGSIGAALAFSLINFSGWLVSLPIYRRVIGSLQLDVWKMPAVGSLMLILIALLSQRLGIPFWLRLPFELIAYGFINREIITVLRLSRQEWTV